VNGAAVASLAEVTMQAPGLTSISTALILSSVAGRYTAIASIRESLRVTQWWGRVGEWRGTWGPVGTHELQPCPQRGTLTTPGERRMGRDP
jgi:hypothetical protein